MAKIIPSHLYDFVKGQHTNLHMARTSVDVKKAARRGAMKTNRLKSIARLIERMRTI